ncbi:hypothetical protein ACI797_14830 [Geodermatophilus sp. SYSU D00691]
MTDQARSVEGVRMADVPRWLGRALLLGALAVAFWLAGSASASAEERPAEPLPALLAAPLEAVPAVVHDVVDVASSAVLEPAVAVLPPAVGEPVPALAGSLVTVPDRLVDEVQPGNPPLPVAVPVVVPAAPVAVEPVTPAVAAPLPAPDAVAPQHPGTPVTPAAPAAAPLAEAGNAPATPSPAAPVPALPAAGDGTRTTSSGGSDTGPAAVPGATTDVPATTATDRSGTSSAAPRGVVVDPSFSPG